MMPIPRNTDAEVIDAIQKAGGIAAAAKLLGLPIRALSRRRRNIEERLNITIVPNHLNSPSLRLMLPENGIRMELDIENGCGIIGSDAHYWPGRKSTAHRAFVIAAKELKPKFVVMNGDDLDGSNVSRHGRIGWEAKPTHKQELDVLQERLSEIVDASKGAKHLRTRGNHDIRYDSYLAGMAPAMEGVYGSCLTDFLPDWNHGWAVMVNDDFMIKHRYHNGIHAIYNNILKGGKSMATGHLHSLKVTPWTDYNGTRYGIDTGTLADTRGPQFTYLEDNPVNWRAGFAVVTFHEGRLLPPELLEVLDEEKGLVCFRGQVVKV